jgi:hypothetical protein
MYISVAVSTSSLPKNQPDERVKVIERISIPAVQLHVLLDGPGDGNVLPAQERCTLAHPVGSD